MFMPNAAFFCMNHRTLIRTDVGPPGNGDLSTDGALPVVCPWKPLHSLNSTLAESCTVLLSAWLAFLAV